MAITDYLKDIVTTLSDNVKKSIKEYKPPVEIPEVDLDAIERTVNDSAMANEYSVMESLPALPDVSTKEKGPVKSNIPRPAPYKEAPGPIFGLPKYPNTQIKTAPASQFESEELQMSLLPPDKLNESQLGEQFRLQHNSVQDKLAEDKYQKMTPVERLYKESLDKADEKSRYVLEPLAQGFTTGLFGVETDPRTIADDPEDFAQAFIRNGATLGGFLLGLVGVGGAVSSEKLALNISKFVSNPKAVTALTALSKSSIDFSLLGQVHSFLSNESAQEHLARLPKDILAGAGFTLMGMGVSKLPNLAMQMAAEGTLWAGIVKLQGGSDQDALIQGIQMAGLRGFGYSPTKKNIENIYRESRKVLEVKEGASKKEINEAFNKKTKDLRPNTKEFAEAEASRAILLEPTKLVDAINLYENRLIGLKGGKEGREGIERPGRLLEPKVLEKLSTKETKEAVKKLKPVLSEVIEVRENTLLKERIKNYARGVRSGIVETKKEIKNFQDDLIKLLDESSLDKADKETFVKRIKNTQTAKQFEKVFPEMELRIEELEKTAALKYAKSDIKKELASTKVRKQEGKPVGKFTPETQKVFDVLRSSTNLTKEQAVEKLASNLEAEIITPEMALQNKVLSMLTGESTPLELDTFLQSIKEMKDTGKMINELKKFNISSEIQAEKDLVLNQIYGGKGVPKGTETVKTKKPLSEKLKMSLKTLGQKWVLDWSGLMKTLDFNAGVKNQILSKQFSTLIADNNYKIKQKEFTDNFVNLVSESYGIENKPYKTSSIIMGLQEVVDMGKFKNSDGVEVKLEMTKDEIIKRWMELKDPTLRESLENGNKYTPEIIDAINKQMSPQDIAFAEGQLDIYRKHYNDVNEVYKDLYGVDLPSNEFYSPIRRKGFKVDTNKRLGEFLGEANHRTGLKSSSLKTRSKNTLPIEQQGSSQALQNHMTETNYFIAWGKKMRRFNAVFKDQEIREAIVDQFGNKFLNTIDNSLSDMTYNGNRTARFNSVVDFFRKGHTLGALALKPLIAAKQMVSTLAYAERLSLPEFSTGIADFFKNPIENYRTLNKESALIATRGENIERDIKAAASEFKGKKLGKYFDILMTNVKIGDKGAIILGSWAMRKAALKKGLSLEEAIREYEEFSSETQQSSDISRLSEVQRGSSLERLFTMYKSSPRQYLQKETNAIKSLFQKDGLSKDNIKQVAKTMFIYHVALPFTFQYLSNMGGWSEEDKKDYMRSIMLGSLNGLFIAGDVMDGILRQAFGQYVFDNELPIYQIGKDIQEAISKIDFNDITTEDMASALWELSDAGNTVGIPVKQMKSMGSGAIDIANGSTEEGMAKIMGWSDYRVKQSFGEEGSGGIDFSKY